MSLTLYKQGPKTYRFLSKIFILPSKSTLNKLLKSINFEAGINMNIIQSLATTAEKMDTSDKYVTVIFDGMAIMPSVNFNERLGYVEGFEDFGVNNRTIEIADHVLMFMVRGLKENFKQPLAYAFSARGGARHYQIKELLLQLLTLLINAGFYPISTVCDQSTTNVKLINDLLNDTRSNYLRRGKECKGLYECDNGPNTIGGLKALTDEHIYEYKMKKIKVEHAAQIFSSRVASTLKLASSLDSDYTRCWRNCRVAILL